MKLNEHSLGDRAYWERNSIELPRYDFTRVAEKTRKNPQWVHFGAGNIFRGYIARLQQVLLNRGLADTGIIAVETFDYEIIDRIYTPFDNLTLSVGLKPDGSLVNEVVSSVAEVLKADFKEPRDWDRLSWIFEQNSLQLVSFTMTEKGYTIYGLDGKPHSLFLEDCKNGPGHPKHAMSIVASLMYKRYLGGAAPIALVSMDNCSHNGEKLRLAVLEVSTRWFESGFVPQAYIDYLLDEDRVTWPWTMIDKITPRPEREIESRLNSMGLFDMEPIITKSGTYIAPFVNSELPEYLVIEDRFPNGRPELERAGVYFSDRETVNQTERMKVTTCLNPLHSALAMFGCLLGYTSIAHEMGDSDLKLLVEKIGYSEAMPVVPDPKIISPEEFIREVIEERLPNPYIPDMPQRIATDMSLKIGIRFGETIKAYISHPNLEVRSLRFIPLVLAAWFRYLLGVNDAHEPMEVSSDPRKDEIQALLVDISVGDPESGQGKLEGILSNASLFGVDLVECGLSSTIENYFCKMLGGPGAVRRTLQNALQEAVQE